MPLCGSVTRAWPDHSSSLAESLGLGAEIGSRDFPQLKRLTLIVTDTTQAAVAAQVAQHVRDYHIIAVRPTNGPAWEAVVQQNEFDIISLCLEDRLSFLTRRKDIDPFYKRGGVLEIEFAPALRDPNHRRQLVANVEVLLHCTRGRNLLLTSGARDAMELRSPSDIANFASVLGFRGGLANRCMSDVALKTLQRGAMRRGCVQITQVPGSDDDRDEAMDTA